jgi:hypothetical protein
MTVLYAKDLTLKDVQDRLQFEREHVQSFDSLLALEPLTDFEEQELIQIRRDFETYVVESKVLEGMIKALTIFPLLRLTGYYQHPIKLKLEENIAPIDVEDGEKRITGRFDLLAINKPAQSVPLLWVLVVETKNSKVEARAGLPQLLAHAHSSLQSQPSVWGLCTNGMSYQFVPILRRERPIYQILPLLDLIEPEIPTLLLQVLKAIRNGSVSL